MTSGSGPLLRGLRRAGELAILPVALPCNMDSYGLIMRSDHVLTPGANRLLGAIRKVASGRH